MSSASTSTRSPCGSGAPGRSSASRSSAVVAILDRRPEAAHGVGDAAAVSRSTPGRAAVDDLVARGLEAPVVCVIDGHRRVAQGRRARLARGPASSAVPSTSFATSSARPRSTPWPSSAPTSTGSSTPRAPRPPGPPVRPSSGSGRPAVPAWSEASTRGAKSCSRSSEFPKGQWKTLRTTNVIERLHEEFRRRVKTQGSLPTEDAALVLLFGLVASGQIRLRRLDGWRHIPAVLRAAPPVGSMTHRALASGSRSKGVPIPQVCPGIASGQRRP